MAKKLTPAELGAATAETVKAMVERRGAKLTKDDLKQFFIAFGASMMSWLIQRRL